jgi:hypothetical protein
MSSKPKPMPPQKPKPPRPPKPPAPPPTEPLPHRTTSVEFIHLRRAPRSDARQAQVSFSIGFIWQKIPFDLGCGSIPPPK